MHHIASRSPAAGLMRASRAAVLAVPVVGVSMLAHRVADGCLSLLGSTLAALLCWSTAVLILDREAGVRRLLILSVGAQAAAHLTLSATCTSVVGGHETLLSHLAGGASSSMLLAHAVSAVVCAGVLARADAAFWTAHRLGRAVARLLRSWLVELPVLQMPRTGQRRPVEMLLPGLGLVAGRLPTRRGPPQPLTA